MWPLSASGSDLPRDYQCQWLPSLPIHQYYRDGRPVLPVPSPMSSVAEGVDDVVTIPVIARVRRLLELACEDWKSLPALSAAVVNDDSSRCLRQEQEACFESDSDSEGDDDAAAACSAAAGARPVKKQRVAHELNPPLNWWRVQKGYHRPQSSRWLRHPCAMVWNVGCRFQLEQARDVPTITVDGVPFNPDMHTVPSGYGDLATCTTKFDPDVRRCTELVARDGVEVTFLDPSNNPLVAFLPLVQTALYPTTPIALRLKKINVYPKGGHFSRHVDTPRLGTRSAPALAT